MFHTECSHNTLLKLQDYFRNNGDVVIQLKEYEGLDNKEFGDAHVALLHENDTTSEVNIDFKKQTRKEDRYIYIELVQVNAKGQYSSWLYNDNIDLCVYEFNDGSTYLLKHNTLIGLAKYYAFDNEVWNTSIIYRKNEDAYKEEREWIQKELSNYKNVQPICIRGGVIYDDDIHINGAFNYNKYSKQHSGFCLCVPRKYLKKYSI
jgi:hypothetical protein